MNSEALQIITFRRATGSREDLCSNRLRQLYCRQTDAARRGVNQDAFASLQARDVLEREPCSQECYGQPGGFIKGQLIGFSDGECRGCGNVRCKTTRRESNDCI